MARAIEPDDKVGIAEGITQYPTRYSAPGLCYAALWDGLLDLVDSINLATLISISLTASRALAALGFAG